MLIFRRFERKFLKAEIVLGLWIVSDFQSEKVRHSWRFILIQISLELLPKLIFIFQTGTWLLEGWLGLGLSSSRWYWQPWHLWWSSWWFSRLRRDDKADPTGLHPNCSSSALQQWGRRGINISGLCWTHCHRSSSCISQWKERRPVREPIWARKAQ